MLQQCNDYISRPITTHGRISSPHQGARHGTVDHGDASDGVFLLLHLWVLPPRWAILLQRSPSSLSLVCGWPPGANGSLSREWQCLQGRRVEDPSSARKGGPNRPQNWARLAGLGWPAQAHPGPVRRPFAPMGPHALMHFSPSTCTILKMSSSHQRWRFSVHEVRSFTLHSLGMFLCNTSVLATIGSDFIKLMNTNKTPLMLLWNRCESVLYVHVFLHKHNTSKCRHIDELVIWLVCLAVG
jgi:hypothetical protein